MFTVSYHVTSTLPFAWPTAIKFSGSDLGYHATHYYKGIHEHHNNILKTSTVINVEISDFYQFIHVSKDLM